MTFNPKQLSVMANAARAGALRAIGAAHSGHVGVALGAADMMTVVYANHLRRGIDRFVLSAGHGSALLYSVLDLAGYAPGDLSSFRKLGGLSGHPEYGTPGVETSTGPLGQGVGNAVGMARAGKIVASRKSQVVSKVYCLCSDGDLMEGVALESIAFAGRYKLNNLVMLWDDNGISIDGVVQTAVDIPVMMAANGWAALYINGNDPAQIDSALDAAVGFDRPVFIACRTTIGLGSSIAGTNAAHGFALSDSEMTELIGRFDSESGKKLWHESNNVYDELGVNNSPLGGSRRAVTRAGGGTSSVGDTLCPPTGSSVATMRAGTSPTPPKGGVVGTESKGGVVSTRELSGAYLEKILPLNPLMIGGSADLAENTHTRPSSARDITANDFSGNFINYGVREHAMAAIMNGMTLSGLRPYGGTFLVFSDYMRPAIRLAALMGIPTIFVFSHDSVGVGEDGPTHQPIEQLAALRAIPNLLVLRPADSVEVAAAWDIALAQTNRPSCIILTRQKIPPVHGTNAAGVIRGAYTVTKSEIRNQKSEITLIATGSELSLAQSVASILESQKVTVNVVSMPSMELFRAQSDPYQKSILRGRVIAIEAGATQPWYEFADAVFGIDSFGRGGAGDAVYRSFGFEPDAIAAEILTRM